MPTQLNHNDYTVAWIAPLPIEVKAALRVLDRRHDGYFTSAGTDDYSYVGGEINGHFIVIATFRAGQSYGVGSAAALVNQVKTRFPKIRFALLIGVAAGLPNLSTDDPDRHRDIRLGDVLVALPDKYETGIVHYGLGKETDQGFLRVGRQAEPPAIILSAISWIQIDEKDSYGDGSHLADYLLALQATKGGGQFKYPGQELDQLFQVSPDGITSFEPINRVPRSEDERTRVWYGNIGSGDSLMRKPARRDELRDLYDLIGLEMEAAGVVNSIPTAVIRGVCDYADGHKTKIWQPYAAAVAAVYAKGILCHIAYEDDKMKHDSEIVVKAPSRLREVDELLNLRLHCASGAEFNDYDLGHETCHPGTRVDLLQEVSEWANEHSGKRIFWLCGMAGTGKSTISRTIAEHLHQTRELQDQATLGASFFFKRGGGDRASAVRFFPTIARQLARRSPALASLIAEELEAEPNICNKSLGEQFERLISQPLQRLNNPSTRPSVFVAVVDALDECDNEHDLRAILRLWSCLPETRTVVLKMFLTSRPELPIVTGFRGMPTETHHDFRLHEIALPVIRQDIHTYFKYKILQIRRDHHERFVGSDSLEKWPGEQTIEVLTDQANPLFIAAATMCRFISQRYRDPVGQLDTILASKGRMYMSQVDAVYMTVLEQFSAEIQDDLDSEHLYEEFRRMIGSIILLAEPLSVQSLATLLQVPADVLLFRLQCFSSVLQVPNTVAGMVRILHLSFREFLLSESIMTKPFWIDLKATHRMLLEHCLTIMTGKRGLRENICDIDYPGKLRRDVDENIIHSHIPFELRYACRFWVFHLEEGGLRAQDDGRVSQLLSQHFLHWLEALSFMDRLRTAINSIDKLLAIFSHTNTINLKDFLRDARRFYQAHRSMIDLAPLQLYCSVLVFAPQNSFIQTVYNSGPTWLLKRSKFSDPWTSESQRLTITKQDGPRSLAFSPNGKHLALASWPGKIQRWELDTGEEMRALTSEPGLPTMCKRIQACFSRDGESLHLASSSGELLQIYDESSAQRKTVGGLRRYGQLDQMFTFSMDGTLVASADMSHIISLVNVTTGRAWRGQYGSNEETLVGLTFYQNNLFLASRLRDLGINVLKAEVALGAGDGSLSISVIHTIPGHIMPRLDMRPLPHRRGDPMEDFQELMFSHDASLLAMIESHGFSPMLWNCAERRREHWLKPARSTVNMVFSTTAPVLALARIDFTIELWHTRAASKLRIFTGHMASINDLKFSGDGTILASVAKDETVRLWEVEEPSVVIEDTTLSLQHHYSRWIRDENTEVITKEGQWVSAYSPCGIFGTSAASGGPVCVFNVASGQPIAVLDSSATAVSLIKFSSDGSFLACGHTSGSCELWRLQADFKSYELHLLPTHRGKVRSLVFSLDNTLLAALLDTEDVLIWSTVTGQLVEPIVVFGCQIKAIVFNSAKELVALTFIGPTALRFFNVVTSEILCEIDAPLPYIRGLSTMSFSADGPFLAASGGLGILVCHTQMQLLTDYFIISNINEIAFAPNNDYLITNRGIIPLRLRHRGSNWTSSSELGCENLLFLDNDWITVNDKRFLWLPHEYRQSKNSFIYGNILAVGMGPEQMVSFDFDVACEAMKWAFHEDDEVPDLERYCWEHEFTSEGSERNLYRRWTRRMKSEPRALAVQSRGKLEKEVRGTSTSSDDGDEW